MAYLHVVQGSAHNVEVLEEIVAEDVLCLWCHLVLECYGLVGGDGVEGAGVRLEGGRDRAEGSGRRRDRYRRGR